MGAREQFPGGVRLRKLALLCTKDSDGEPDVHTPPESFIMRKLRKYFLRRNSVTASTLRKFSPPVTRALVGLGNVRSLETFLRPSSSSAKMPTSPRTHRQLFRIFALRLEERRPLMLRLNGSVERIASAMHCLQAGRRLKCAANGLLA